MPVTSSPRTRLEPISMRSAQDPQRHDRVRDPRLEREERAEQRQRARRRSRSVRAESQPYSLGLHDREGAEHRRQRDQRPSRATSTPGRRPMPSFSSISARPSTNATTPIGTLTKKIQCQSSDCVSAPPASRPIEPPPADDERVQRPSPWPARRARELGDDDREDHARGDRAADALEQARADQHPLAVGEPAQRPRRR